ncbi:MAG: response regulator transcription factor [Lachnospiraceae bacterium]|nr:response regulator transcription factor [Lachnospiraceae bacterium]
MLHIAICDDDQEDMEKLRVLITEIFNKYYIHCDIMPFHSGEELLASTQVFSLIFLDIKMKEQDGIEIGKAIYRRDRTIKVIFQTYYREYCSAAINKSHAFGFLEKPVDRNLLEEQIKEFLTVKETEQEMWMKFSHVYLDDKKQEWKECLKLPIKDILYFENVKRDKYIRVHTQQVDFMYLNSISVLEKRMNALGFELCNRGILVNLARIKKIKRYNIILCNDAVLPLSQRRAMYFKERMNEFARNE